MVLLWVSLKCSKHFDVALFGKTSFTRNMCSSLEVVKYYILHNVFVTLELEPFVNTFKSRENLSISDRSKGVPKMPKIYTME